MLMSVSGCLGMAPDTPARGEAAQVVERMACLPECKGLILSRCLPALMRVLASSLDVVREDDDGAHNTHLLASVTNALWLLVELPDLKSHKIPAHLQQQLLQFQDQEPLSPGGGGVGGGVGHWPTSLRRQTQQEEAGAARPRVDSDATTMLRRPSLLLPQERLPTPTGDAKVVELLVQEMSAVRIFDKMYDILDFSCAPDHLLHALLRMLTKLVKLAIESRNANTLLRMIGVDTLFLAVVGLLQSSDHLSPAVIMECILAVGILVKFHARGGKSLNYNMDIVKLPSNTLVEMLNVLRRSAVLVRNSLNTIEADPTASSREYYKTCVGSCHLCDTACKAILQLLVLKEPHLEWEDSHVREMMSELQELSAALESARSTVKGMVSHRGREGDTMALLAASITTLVQAL